MENNLRDSLVKPGERVDDLQNGYYVIQNPEKFCFGMDAVLLSGFAKIKKDERVLDMGSRRHRESILPDWRYRRNVPKWRREA